MSGIACRYNLDGRPVEPARLARMTEAMAHRGPDRRARWHEGALGLGHCMLETTPESRTEHLPLTRGALTITADARIDNRRDLLAALGLASRDEAMPDSLLILHSYERWGTSCVDHLVGDFAFVIWDAVEERLFCARDHFGVRPFYYHHAPGVHFVCASEIKALLTQPGVPERLNEVRVGDYLSGMREDAEITIYEDIWRLPPAHTLTVDDSGRVALRRYWELKPAAGVAALSESEQVSRFRDLFEEAVRCRMRSAYPVVSELSGGLDSSYVTSVARAVAREREERLHTVSLVFDEIEECDERAYIESVLGAGEDVEAHYVAGDAVGPLSNLDELYTLLDDGLVGNNQQFGWAMLQEAKSVGARVVLDGIDGDTTVSHGLLYLRELARQGRWETFARYMSELEARHQDAEHKQQQDQLLSSRAAMFKSYAVAYLDECAEEGHWQAFWKAVTGIKEHLAVPRNRLFKRYWRKLLAPHWLIRARRARQARHESLPPLVNQAFARRIGLRERLDTRKNQKPQSVFEAQRSALSHVNVGLYNEITSHRGAMLGLEIRHPFMDKRLVEFCLALPADMRLRDGWTRYIMRRAMEDIVPDNVAWRVGKGNLGPGFSNGLLKIDAELLEQYILEADTLRDYINMDFVLDQYRRREDLSLHEHTVLSDVATLAVWLRKKFGDRKELAVERNAMPGPEQVFEKQSITVTA